MDTTVQTVNILGSPWTIRCPRRDEDVRLKNDETCAGYCDSTTRTIVVCDLVHDTEEVVDRLEDQEVLFKRALRHELVHAVLCESGLDADSWAVNEEMVDWIAIQFEKLLLLFVETGALELLSSDVAIGRDLLIDAALTPEKLASVCSTTTLAKEVN